MDGSILTDTKKIVGIAEADTSFDHDLIAHINSVFSILFELGVGPPTGFQIEDKSDQWSDFTDDDLHLNSVQSYMYLKVKMIFDPPSTSFHLSAMEKQIQEFEWRLANYREPVPEV